jgi:hypothetical protein
MISLERDRQTAIGLVLVAAAAMGGAAALWRPAEPAVGEPTVIFDDVAGLEAEPEGADADIVGLTDDGPRGTCHVYLVYDDPPVALDARHIWLRSFGAWLLALIGCGLAMTVLARIGTSRRPLSVALRTPRPVPGLLMAVLILPMLPQLVLVHAGCPLLPSLLWLGSTAGGLAAAVMLLARRRLAGRLRWAIDGGGRLAALDDGTLVALEVEPAGLVLPPGEPRVTPWFRADLAVRTGGEAGRAPGETARVALEDALVDDAAAQRIAAMAAGNGEPRGPALTVLGRMTRVPAEAAAADPLCRTAPLEARLGPGALIVAGTRAELVRRLRTEGALLVVALLVCIGAALFAS